MIEAARSAGCREPKRLETAIVLGAILIAICLLVVLPALFWATVGALSAVLSVTLTDYAEATHEGSDLIATNI